MIRPTAQPTYCFDELAMFGTAERFDLASNE